MILTGQEIDNSVRAGRIDISPYSPSQLNPNSYNYKLACILKVSCSEFLDSMTPIDWKCIKIDHRGFVLEPGRLYLGSTVEKIGSSVYVPSLIGRSSLGRLGMFLQASADLGNLGAVHRWTLEIKVIQKLKVYSNMFIGQVSFWKPYGEIRLYNGVYDKFSEPTPCQQLTSSIWKDENK